MNARTTIKKIFFVAIWFCIGGGMLTLLLAAISKKNKERCTGYTITLQGAKNSVFIDEKDVELLLKKVTGGNITGTAVTAFRLYEVEQALKKNDWISGAELFFDNRDLLHVTVTEKEPVARVFGNDGSSFYIDSLGSVIPLSDKLSARVPVFTGYPGKKTPGAKDSMLLQEIRGTANYILSHPFWMAQVAQVDITPERKFEMIPVVGNHLVRLGNGEDIAEKFHRLMVFYRQVLSKTGFEKYKLIDVQYKGQVVASKYAGDPKVDSVQLRKNVEKLLRESLEAANDTVARQVPPISGLEEDSVMVPEQQEDISPGQKQDPNPRLTRTSRTVPSTDGGQALIQNNTKKKETKTTKPGLKEKNVETRKPKAVMPARPEEEKNGKTQ